LLRTRDVRERFANGPSGKAHGRRHRSPEQGLRDNRKKNLGVGLLEIAADD
jgi:hypothetical protein